MDKNRYLGNKDAAEYLGVNLSTFFSWVETGKLKIPYDRGMPHGGSYARKRVGKLYRVRDLDIVKEKLDRAKRYRLRFNPRGVFFGESPEDVTHTPIDLKPEPMPEVKPVPFPNDPKVDPIDINKMIKTDMIAQEALYLLLKDGGLYQSQLKRDVRKWIEEYVNGSYTFKRRVMDMLIESLKNDIPTIKEVEKASGMKAIHIFLIIQAFAMCLMACAIAFGGK